MNIPVTLMTDNPIKYLWSYFGLLMSTESTKEFLRRRATTAGHEVNDDIFEKKAQDLVFCIRNAREYFETSPSTNLTSVCLGYYYGTLCLLEALLLADTAHSTTLDDIEQFTTRGHGIATFSQSLNNVAFPDSECVHLLRNGFFAEFLTLRLQEQDIVSMTLQKRLKSEDDFNKPDTNKELVFTVKDLLSRVPELMQVYVETFQAHPESVACLQPQIEVETIRQMEFYKSFNSEFLTPSKVRDILGWSDDIPLNENNNTISLVTPYSASILAEKSRYRSVMTQPCYVKPLIGLDDPLYFSFLLLYTLSIWVRYRPSLWREVTEGNLNSFRPLVVSFLIVVERVVPNIVLNYLYEREVRFETSLPFA